VTDESLSPDKTEKLIEYYLFVEREPIRDKVLELIDGEKPGDGILKRIMDFVETFINGMAGK
jgi:type I restriction enzyme, R subunit